MTLEQLRIFVAVAERQHVTEAARALNLAQSAASHAIASLEMRHDTKLFNRVGRHIELTEAGRALLVEARTILAQVERAELALSEFGNLGRGTLTIQASQTIASYWLPRHLVAFRRGPIHVSPFGSRLEIRRRWRRPERRSSDLLEAAD
jgi:DNA-binding transcriptional LysR family regulator